MKRLPLWAALAALFLPAPAAPQSLQDAVVDCRRGPVILGSCYKDCKKKLFRDFDRRRDIDKVNEEYMKCRTPCDAMAVVLEECKR